MSDVPFSAFPFFRVDEGAAERVVIGGIVKQRQASVAVVHQLIASPRLDDAGNEGHIEKLRPRRRRINGNQ